MSRSSLSERDLLIELTTEIRFIKEIVEKLTDKVDDGREAYSALLERVTVLEQQTLENTRLRNWVYASSIGLIVNSIAIVINYLI